MEVLYAIFAAIALLGPLVAIHEFGHYWTARLFGVKVLTYSIGFGPQLLKWQSKKSGIVYQISALPLGGYVKMLDERESEAKGEQIPEADLPKAFNRQKVWKRFLIVFAGPAINLLFAVLLFWILFLPEQTQLNTRIGKVLPNTPAHAVLKTGDKIVSVDHQETDSWQKVHLALINRVGETGQVNLGIERNQAITQVSLPIENFLNGQQHISPVEMLGFLPYRPTIKPIISEIVEGSAASLQGLQIGDEIISINGVATNDQYDVVNIVRKSPEILLNIDVLRQQERVSLQVMPQAKSKEGQQYGSLGVAFKHSGKIEVPAEYKQVVHYTPTQALARAVDETVATSQMIVSSVIKMIRGMIGLDNLSGPITIAKVAGQTAELGWESFVGFMAMMSISLGILNLLPIPMLDGGHLVYYIAEMIRGKPVSEKIQIFGFKIGMLLLGSMMILALFNDFMRL